MSNILVELHRKIHLYTLARQRNDLDFPKLSCRPIPVVEQTSGGTRPVRVLQITSTIAEVYGGPSTVAVELNRELRRQGVDARILSSSLNGPPGSTITDAELSRLDESGADYRLYRPSPPWRLQGSWGLAVAIFREVRHSDWVHVDGQHRIAHLAAFYAAKLWRVPYGVQPHGSLDPYFRRRSLLGKAFFNLLALNRYIRDAERIYFTADSEAVAAGDLVTKNQAVVAPLGASRLPPVSSPSLALVLNRTPRQHVVLFLGRLAAKKRPDLLLEAWSAAALPAGALLIMAGPEDDFTIQELENKACVLGISKSVHFAGQVSGGEKSWLYSSCGVFVLASENENFGLTVGEAMLAGCHVISSKGVAASSLLEASSSGEVLADMSVQSLATSLERALNDPAATSVSGDRAFRYASTHLGWSTLAEAIRCSAEAARRDKRRETRGTN